MSLIKPLAEKLPLTARKNVRDEWETPKATLEAKMLALTSVPWKFEVNPLEVWPYAEEGSYGHHSLGACIHAYFEAFVDNLSYFLSTHKEAGVKELNSVCPSQTITLIPSEKFTYSGCYVADGKMNLCFHPNNLGVNINYVGQELAVALSTAPQPAGASTLSYMARHSVKEDYEPKIGALLAKARTQLHSEKFTFDPCFDALGEKLKSGGKDVRDDWETNLGSFALSYFETFVEKLEREKFGEDEMLREGLEEMAEKQVCKLNIVEKLVGGNGYNEILIVDGGLVIQTTPGNWGTNIHYAAEKLVDIL